MSERHQIFATCAKGLPYLLAEELRALGAENIVEKQAVVTFNGDVALAYKACLWSRIASRILWPLATVPVKTPEELYAAVQAIDWREHLDVDGTLAVRFVASQSEMTHTLFGAQKVKDAIVDQFQAHFDKRPSVDKDTPDLAIFVHLHKNQATIAIDLSGQPLHKRGYRQEGVAAPLKETLAAGILTRLEWAEIAKQGGALFDPMCGSGTFLIEGAMIATDMAPGLLRTYFGFQGWKKHDASIWRTLIDEAENRFETGLQNMPKMVGYDVSRDAVTSSAKNIMNAGFGDYIRVEKCDLNQFRPVTKLTPGLVVANPPYGERLSEVDVLKPLYKHLGDVLKTHFDGWAAGILTNEMMLGKQLGLRAQKKWQLFNGAIAVQLLKFEVSEKAAIDNSPAAESVRLIARAKRACGDHMSETHRSFVNRLKKNFKHRSKVAKREGKVEYRVYDRDIPEYAFAIDITAKGVLVFEYAPPHKLSKQLIEQHRNEVLAVLPEILGVSPEQISGAGLNK